MINFSSINKESSEVYTSIDRTLSVEKNDISQLISTAKKNPSGKVRLCSHINTDEAIHEMFIAHREGTYVRPHKHLDKTESMLVIEGVVDYLIFNDDGKVREIIKMGDYESGKSFYQSTSANTYHGLLIHSEWLVFLEITKGPFISEKTIFASWSPEKSEQNIGLQFIRDQYL
jgi:cupin fold WbuC family metalloprotein